MSEHKKWTPEESCFLYWKFYHKKVRGINIRKFKNFDKQKEDVTKWLCFEHLALIANKYNINLYEYIPMVCNRFEGKFFHPKVLINPGTLRIWSDRQKEIKRAGAHEKVVKEYIRSMKFVVKFCVDNDLHSFREYMRATIKGQLFGLHYVSGKLSKYFMCFIPNLSKLKLYIDPDISNQLDRLVIQHVDALRINTITAMKELKNVDVTQFIRLIDHNIHKKEALKKS